MSNERESKTFLARLCEQAERYDEMVTYMKEVAKLGGELTVDERNLQHLLVVKEQEIHPIGVVFNHV